MPRRVRAAVVAALGLLVLVLAGTGVTTLWSPPEPQASDDSNPVLLQSIRDLDRYVSAQGTFEVAVVLREGYPRVPTWVYGYEGVLIALGTVDANVDLAGLPADRQRCRGGLRREGRPNPGALPRGGAEARRRGAGEQPGRPRRAQHRRDAPAGRAVAGVRDSGRDVPARHLSLSRGNVRRGRPCRPSGTTCTRPGAGGCLR
jgi:hypothetical protein